MVIFSFAKRRRFSKTNAKIVRELIYSENLTKLALLNHLVGQHASLESPDQWGSQGSGIRWHIDISGEQKQLVVFHTFAYSLP